MTPKLSIIIPCYNQGHFLDECIGSFESQIDDSIEVIIINDGSTSADTVSHIKGFEEKGYSVIHQENRGLAEARNTGIRHAKGKYILPLDADNKIRMSAVVNGIQKMESDDNISVIYGDAEYFGEKTGRWHVGPFNLQKLMVANYIDACALIRKSVFDELGGYDSNMKYSGWEDWEFWLRLSFHGRSIFYLNDILFEYRVLTGSMSRVLYKDYLKPNYLETYVNNKFPDKMNHEFLHDHYTNRFKKSPVLFVFKMILRAWFPIKYNELLLKNKIRNGI